MKSERIAPLRLHAELEQWPLVEPFRISNYTWEALDVLMVRLEQDGTVGEAEAAGVYYRNDKPPAMLQQIERLRPKIESGLSRAALQTWLPPGGARNALDGALWDLEAKRQGAAVWQLAGLEKPRPLITTMTCGAETPEKMAQTAQSYKDARAIKLKLTGDPIDADRVRAVRNVKPDAWLGVDANQGFTRESLEHLMPVLVDAKVALIEQPFPVGKEALLDGFQSPIPVAADETAQDLNDLAALVGRFQVVNIKLDKCGGLTEGLAMARAARSHGLEVMVGNMLGTSLAMAPAYLVGQLCSVVDLDGPLFLKNDRNTTIEYKEGLIHCPPEVWGS